MDKKNKIFSLSVIILASILFISSVSAVIVNNVDQSKMYPGETGTLNIELKNNLEQDIEDLSFVLDLSKLSFSTLGSSEKSVDEIEEDEDENIEFTIKPAQDIKPGEYNLPYILTYSLTDDFLIESNKSPIVVKMGTIGLTVGAKTELIYSVSAEDSIVGSRGKINFRIINRGLGDTKFVNVKIIPEGFSLLSNEEVYIGTVNSNDFETTTFDVIFNSPSSTFNAIVKYKDLENKDYQQTIKLPVKVYTREEALSLGLVQQNYAWVYGLFLVLVIIVYLVYRKFKKSKKKRQKEE